MAGKGKDTGVSTPKKQHHQKPRKTWADAEKERARAVYATTGSYSEAARAVGASGVNVVKRWILNPQAAPAVQAAREEAQVRFVREAWEAVGAYIEHLKKPDTIRATSATPAATVVGILVDKIRLVSGQPTAIEEQRGQVTQRYEYDIVQRVIADPETRNTARDLFRRAIVEEGLGGGRTA